MKKIFSFLNLFIILCLILFIYLFYNKYVNENTFNNKEDTERVISNDKNQEEERLRDDKQIDNIEKKEENVNPLPDLSTLPVERQKIDDKAKEDTRLIGQSTVNGFYENNVYNYSISVPSTWPLKLRGDDNVSLGTTPPKNGQGAIKIEVGENVVEEIEEAKNEAKKYVGMVSLHEEPLTLGGVKGVKLTLTNQMAGVKSFYIVLNKYNLDYIIKYSNESPSFLVQVEAALKTFKFTK